MIRHLTGIDRLEPSIREEILDLAQDYAARLNEGRSIQPVLADRVIMHMFFEHSTRTSTSFEMAAYRLGASVINWDPETSSLSKGESFSDTVATLNAMHPDAVVIRHSEFGAPEFVANNVKCPVINAGDSWREHPTQALLDALTLRQHFGQTHGLTLAICGDIAHSRVASSNIRLLPQMGIKLHIVAPVTLMPKDLPSGVKTFEALEDGLPGCDAVMMLRIQKERIQDGMTMSDAAFFNRYGLTHEKLALANKEVVVMHPGPMNRGIEIADDVADDPQRSLILRQVANGVPLRMAVLHRLIRGLG